MAKSGLRENTFHSLENDSRLGIPMVACDVILGRTLA
jgi:hypothetical protein